MKVKKLQDSLTLTQEGSFGEKKSFTGTLPRPKIEKLIEFIVH